MRDLWVSYTALGLEGSGTAVELMNWVFAV